MGVALFDLDRTLLDCNSGRLWMQHELRAGRISYRSALWATWWMARYHLGLGGGVADAIAAAVATLDGQPEHELAERSAAWFAEHLASHLRPGARHALDRHRAAGDRVVLATSASAYVAHPAAETFGLEPGIFTTFEVVDGRFTGAIASFSYGDHKRTRTEEWAAAEGLDLADATFYTDSATDLALMEAVGRPVAVHPDRRLERVAKRRGWAIERW